VKTLNRDYESVRELKRTEARLKEIYVWSRRAGWTWQAAGAVSGLGGGILAAAAGSLLSAVGWMLGNETSGLSPHAVGSILLLSTIPLLILGAHCLDLLDGRVERNQQAEPDGASKAAVPVSHTRSGVAAVVIFLVLLCGIHLRTQAQQTIFNVPTTDVLDRDKVATTSTDER
jgi:hypothetical protein